MLLLNLLVNQLRLLPADLLRTRHPVVTMCWAAWLRASAV
jgi:hypothetical protein